MIGVSGYIDVPFDDKSSVKIYGVGYIYELTPSSVFAIHQSYEYTPSGKLVVNIRHYVTGVILVSFDDIHFANKTVYQKKDVTHHRLFNTPDLWCKILRMVTNGDNRLNDPTEVYDTLRFNRANECHYFNKTLTNNALNQLTW